MALSKIETRIADGAAIGSFTTGILAMGLAAIGSPSLQTNFAAMGTGAMALGGAAIGARVLYDQMGQKVVEWQTHRAMEKAIAASSPKDLENVAIVLQRLEHALDHRIDVIADSKNPRAQSALGAWVIAARTTIEKSQLFDVAVSNRNTDSTHLPCHWPGVLKALSIRMEGYERMLDGSKIQPVVFHPNMEDTNRF